MNEPRVFPELGGPSVERVPVLFVAFQSGRQANGGLQSLTEILRRLRRVRPILLTQMQSAVTDSWRQLGYEVHVWSTPWPRSVAAQRMSRARRLAGDVIPLLAGNLRMLSLLRSSGIRVVHCNDGWASLIATASARLAGARVVLNIRDTLLVDVQRWSLMRALSDRVIVLSDEMREVVIRHLAPPAWLRGRGETEVTAVYSAVDPARMHPMGEQQRAALRRALGIKEDEVAVGVIGALVAKKQQLELIRYLAQNPSRLPSAVNLYFVGDFDPESDSYARDCEAAAQGPLRDRIRFVGYAADVARWYQALDLTLMVSRFEGLARGMIESVSCGTPVVAFDFCSAREILEGYSCGLVANQGEFGALMELLGQLVREPALRQRLGKNGPELARRQFAPERIADRYEDIYLELHQQATHRDSRPFVGGTPSTAALGPRAVAVESGTPLSRSG